MTRSVKLIVHELHKEETSSIVFLGPPLQQIHFPDLSPSSSMQGMQNDLVSNILDARIEVRGS